MRMRARGFMEYPCIRTLLHKNGNNGNTHSNTTKSVRKLVTLER
jgi:hypothetical protein